MSRYQESVGRAVRADIEAKFKGDFADGAEVTLGVWPSEVVRVSRVHQSGPEVRVY